MTEAADAFAAAKGISLLANSSTSAKLCRLDENNRPDQKFITNRSKQCH